MVEFVTLDGVMQGLGSPDEDRDGGFEHGGWGAPYGDEVQQTAALDGMQGTSAYLFGRRTYQKMLSFWPQQPDDNPMAAHLNATVKYVATRTLANDQLTWSNARVLDGDLTAGIRGVKADGDGSIAVLGSGALVQELEYALELVDGYRLFLHPLLLGSGKRLFHRDRPPKAPASERRGADQHGRRHAQLRQWMTRWTHGREANGREANGREANGREANGREAKRNETEEMSCGTRHSSRACTRSGSRLPTRTGPRRSMSRRWVRDASRRADGGRRPLDRGGARRHEVLAGADPLSQGLPTGTETGVRFATDDADLAHDTLEERSVEVDDILRWPGVPAMFALRDRDGNGLEIIEA